MPEEEIDAVIEGNFLQFIFLVGRYCVYSLCLL